MTRFDCTAILCLVLLDAVILFYGISGNAFAAPNIPVKGYDLVWSDEFNGTALDTKKWNYRNLGPRRDAINVMDTISLDGKGHLVLSTTRFGNKYHTAMIGTQGKFESTFGYFECRAKFQKQIGHWSAFWLQTPTMGEKIGNTAESGTEIDIFEYLSQEGDTIHHTLHWDGYKKNHKSMVKKPHIPGISKGWHTFGLLWTDQKYIFYVDGKKTWQINKAISKRSEYIILSLEVGKWAGDISKAILPDNFYVDYVRVYKKRETAQ